MSWKYRRIPCGRWGVAARYRGHYDFETSKWVPNKSCALIGVYASEFNSDVEFPFSSAIATNIHAKAERVSDFFRVQERIY